MIFRDRTDPRWTGVVIGLMIIGLGTLLFFDQTGLLGWQPSWRVWPFFIVGAGLARFAAPRPDGSRDGGWLIFIGVWLLLDEMRILRLRDSWPVILVAIGLQMIWRAFVRPTQATPPHTGRS